MKGELYESIMPDYEVINKGDYIYSFSNSFKRNDYIVDFILKKYSVEEKYFSNNYYKDKRNRFMKINKTINGDIGVLASFKDANNEILICKDKIFNYKNYGYTYEIKDVTIDGEKLILEHLGMKSIIEELPKLLIELLKEIKLINKEVDINYNIHPFCQYSMNSRIGYIEFLSSFMTREKYIITNQLIRLEQIARQLNINSEYVLNILKQNLECENRKSMIDKINSIAKDDYKTVIVDLATLEMLGNYKKKRKGLEYEFSDVMNISFNDICNIKEQVNRKIKDFC